jgi:tetratricopeptide (TPR) repeat protein
MGAGDAEAAERLLEAGLARYHAGDRGAAEALFRRALAIDPENPASLYLLGLARFEAGDPETAVRLLEKVVVLRPEHAEARLALANLRYWREDYPAAIETYRQAVALAPDNAAALTGLSDALLAGGDGEGALAAARSAVAAAPALATAHLALATALAGLDQLPAAVEAYRAATATALAPDLARAHVGLALALLRSEAVEDALASATRAVAFDETSAEAWLALGTVRHRVGQVAPAVDALRRSIELNPANAAAHVGLGAAYVDLEDYALAEGPLLRAIALDPASKTAHAHLSSLYRLGRANDLARAHALKALELDPELAQAHHNLASLAAAEGRHLEAQHHFFRAQGVTNPRITLAVHPTQRVLLLTTIEGNTPDRHLLPVSHYTRLNWTMDYARQDQMDLPQSYDVVFNAIGDPDLAASTERQVTQFMEICRRPVFNRPERIAHTRRDMAPGLFDGIAGLVVPQVARIEAATLAVRGLIEAAAASGVGLPLLVRPIGSHGGEGLALLTAAADDAAAQAAVVAGLDHYVTAFHDFRSRDGLYRKYRMIFVDRRPYPYHLAIGPAWLVHYYSSGTAEDAIRLAEERRFLDDPEAALGTPAMETLRGIGERLDLDYCGADFTVLDDGRVLLFEANAAMLVHPEAADGPLAHKNPYIERILGAFQSMLAARPGDRSPP